MIFLLRYIFSTDRTDPKDQDSLGNKEEIELLDAETLGPEGINNSILLIAKLTRRERTDTYSTTSVRSAEGNSLITGKKSARGILDLDHEQEKDEDLLSHRHKEHLTQIE